jgi:hypothetical protein
VAPQSTLRAPINHAQHPRQHPRTAQRNVAILFIYPSRTRIHHVRNTDFTDQDVKEYRQLV